MKKIVSAASAVLLATSLAACGTDEAKQKENQNGFRTNCAWRGHLNGGGQGQGSKIS